MQTLLPLLQLISQMMAKWPGERRGKWKKIAVAYYDNIPPLSFFFTDNGMIRKQQMGGRTLTSTRSMANVVWKVPCMNSLLRSHTHTQTVIQTDVSTHTETQNGAGVFPMNPIDFDNRLFRDSSDKSISGLTFQIWLACAKGQVLSVKFV